MALSVGSLLAGRYEVTAPVATGGMGEVWKARDRVLDRVVAVKVLRSEYTGDPSFLARFRNEARHTAALSHPNIASVYDYGEIEQDGQTTAFLVMEFVEGSPLGVLLHQHGRLGVAETLDVLRQSAEGLSAAHAVGMVHRDIKPGNLMVRPDGVVKLTDFGIARARDATPLTRTGMVVGTAQYLSPEQAQGLDVTAASDVYSLGIVGYECLAGARPFDGASQVAIALMQINRPPPPMPADVPAPVRMLVERALAKDPAARFPDGGAFAAAVRAVASGSPDTAATTMLPATDGAGTRFLPATAAGAALGAAGLAGAAGASTNPGTAGFGRTLPPLQGPPVDGDPYGDPRHPLGDDEPARRRTWAWLVAGLVLLAVLGTGAFLLLSGNGTEGPSASPGTTSAAPTTTTTTAPTSTSAAPETVLVDTSSYIGEDVDKVAKQLQGAGLQVDRQEASNAQLAALGIALDKDAVVTSDPANATVTKGSTVVLYFAADKYSPDDGSKQTGKGGGTTTTPARTTAPTTTAAPTTTTTTTTTTTAAATTTTATSPTTAAGGEPAPTTLPPDASAGTGGTAAPGTTG